MIKMQKLEIVPRKCFVKELLWKHLFQYLFFSIFQVNFVGRPVTLFKRDSIIDTFWWIMWFSPEEVFYKTSSDEYFGKTTSITCGAFFEKFVNWMPVTILKKILAQMFSREFGKRNFLDEFFVEHLRTTASKPNRLFKPYLQTSTELPIKACAPYFSSIFYFSPNDSHSKTIKNVFLFHLKSSFRSRDIQFLYIHLPLCFYLSSIALEVDSRKILKLRRHRQLFK